MEPEKQHPTNFSYSARLAGTEPEEPSSPAPSATQVYALMRQGSQWKWTPGIQPTMRNGAYPDRLEVQVRIGEETMTLQFERELVKVSLGSFIPTKSELETLTDVLERNEARWLAVARTSPPTEFMLDAIQRSTERHKQLMADLQMQIAMTES
jgi:hypothetical protein